MKRTAKPSLFFAAYPLKAINESNVKNLPPTSPYLKALLAGVHTERSDLKAFSMLSSSRADRMIASRDNLLPHDIELTEKTWFCSYE